MVVRGGSWKMWEMGELFLLYFLLLRKSKNNLKLSNEYDHSNEIY